MSAAIQFVIGQNLLAYVNQHNALAKMFNCQELDPYNLSVDDRIRLLEKLQHDLEPVNMAGRNLPAEAIDKKEKFYANVRDELLALGRVEPIIIHPRFR